MIPIKDKNKCAINNSEILKKKLFCLFQNNNPFYLLIDTHI